MREQTLGLKRTVILSVNNFNGQRVNEEELGGKKYTHTDTRTQKLFFMWRPEQLFKDAFGMSFFPHFETLSGFPFT